eukprot:3959751-Prorocentrum_lima.AAC.1
MHPQEKHNGKEVGNNGSQQGKRQRGVGVEVGIRIRSSHPKGLATQRDPTPYRKRRVNMTVADG